IWFLGSYDLVKERQWQTPEAKAWRERFLAAERMLDKLGMTSERIGALEHLEAFGPETVVVVPNGRGRISARARAPVADFLRRGGAGAARGVRARRGPGHRGQRPRLRDQYADRPRRQRGALRGARAADADHNARRVLPRRARDARRVAARACAARADRDRRDR